MGRHKDSLVETQAVAKEGSLRIAFVAAPSFEGKRDGLLARPLWPGGLRWHVGAIDKLTLHMQTNPCMSTPGESPPPPVRGDALLGVLHALANPHRLRVLGVLVEGRHYVSQLARELQISRPLLQIHLRKLEQAGLVSSVLELSEDGKAMKFYDVTPFCWNLTPKLIATAAATLTVADREGENGHG